MEQQEQTVDIQKYLQIFLRRKVLIIIILSISVVFSTAAVLIMPDVYRSNCLLLVKGASKLDKALMGGGGAGDIEAKDVLGMVRAKMLSWDAVTEAIEACGLIKDTPKNDPKLIEGLFSKTTRSVSIAPAGGGLIRVSYEGENPYINYKMLDNLVSSFMEFALKFSRTQADDSLEFIDRDLVRLRKNLDVSESKVREFEEKHISEFPLSEGGKMSLLTDANKELSGIERQLMVENERFIALNTKLEKEEASITGEVVTEANPKAKELQRRIIDTEVLLNDMRVRYYDGYPSIGMAEKRLKMLEDKLAEEEENVISKETSVTNPLYTRLLEKKFEMELRLRTLYIRKKDIESQIATLEEQVAFIPALKQEYAKLARDHKIDRELFTQRLQQRSRAELEKELSLSTKESLFSIVEPPRMSYTPLKTKKMKIFLMGIVLGGMAAFGLAFGLEQIDQRFKSVDDAREFLPLPVFGMIPTIITNGDFLKTRRRKRRQLISAGVAVVLLIALTTVCLKVEPVNEAMHAGLEKIQKKVGKLK